MKPPQSHKPFLLLAVAVFLLVAALYAYMQWQVNVSAGKAIVARDLALAEKDHKSHESELIHLYESTATKRALLGGLFIPSDATVQFIEALESIGPQSATELTLSSIEADTLDNAKPGTRGSMKAHVEARGSWLAVEKAILFSERLPYKVTVNNIRLSTSVIKGSKGQREWQVSFDINASVIVTPPVAVIKP